MLAGVLAVPTADPSRRVDGPRQGQGKALVLTRAFTGSAPARATTAIYARRGLPHPELVTLLLGTDRDDPLVARSVGLAGACRDRCPAGSAVGAGAGNDQGHGMSRRWGGSARTALLGRAPPRGLFHSCRAAARAAGRVESAFDAAPDASSAGTVQTGTGSRLAVANRTCGERRRRDRRTDAGQTAYGRSCRGCVRGDITPDPPVRTALRPHPARTDRDPELLGRPRDSPRRAMCGCPIPPPGYGWNSRRR